MKDPQHPFELEKHRLDRYMAFADLYDIKDRETFVELYEIDELQAFLPVSPTSEEKSALNQLVGVKGVSGYMDYVKSNHTFELIMQWQEMTGNHERTALFLTPKDENRNI
ncbi:MAG: hypothetical protein AAGM67_13365 [Bacteroidota bacterium]